MSHATYQGITYPIGLYVPILPGGPTHSGNAWFIDMQGTFAVPLITGDQTVALTVPMVIGGNFFLQGAQHTFTGSAIATFTLGLNPDQRWRTDALAVTVDPVATPVPEPASILLVGTALGAAAWRKVRGIAKREVSPQTTDQGSDGGIAC